MKFLHLLIALFFFNLVTNAQNVGIGTATPNASAKLEVSSTNSGFLPPRMSFAQRNAIANPSQGLMIYCMDCGTKGQAQIFDGTDWTDLNGGFTRPNVIVDTLNNSVTIGNQIWMSKNLSVARYRNGDPIPQVTGYTSLTNLTTGAWCWYNNDSATYGSKYGRLYNWYAVNDARGLAPQGWHVASDVEWKKLIKSLDVWADTNSISSLSISAGGQLKNKTDWIAPNVEATNSSGFSALPGGTRDYNITFYGVGEYGYFWSASQISSSVALNYRLSFNNSNVSTYNYFEKGFFFSVRCIKD